MPATRKRGSTRTPAARRRARPRPRRRRAHGLRDLGRSAFGRLSSMPALDQRGRDVLGLGLAAVGVFMGVVLYGGWDGGRAGHGLAVALGWVLGRARVLAPIALLAGGGLLLLRPVLPAIRPLRAGVICLFATFTLAMAAGTLGVSSGSPDTAEAWKSSALQSHGGVVGEALYQAAHRLVGGLGVGILVLFLLLATVVLLTGASLAGA